jgi:hypothetical protein
MKPKYKLSLLWAFAMAIALIGQTMIPAFRDDTPIFSVFIFGVLMSPISLPSGLVSSTLFVLHWFDPNSAKEIMISSPWNAVLWPVYWIAIFLLTRRFLKESHEPSFWGLAVLILAAAPTWFGLGLALLSF